MRCGVVSLDCFGAFFAKQTPRRQHGRLAEFLDIGTRALVDARRRLFVHILAEIGRKGLRERVPDGAVEPLDVAFGLRIVRQGMHLGDREPCHQAAGIVVHDLVFVTRTPICIEKGRNAVPDAGIS